MPQLIPPSHPSRRSVILILFLITAPLYGVVGYFANLSRHKGAVLLSEILLLLPAYLFLHFRHYNVRRVFRLNPVSRRLAFLSAGLAVAIYLVLYEIDRLIMALWRFLWQVMPPELSLLSPEYMQAQLEQTLLAHSSVDWILLLLAPVAIAGICEEMLFRGFVQTTFERHHKINAALAITAALFAINHAAPWWFAQIFLLGLVLGWLARQSDSMIPGAIVHTLNNFFAVLLVNFKIASTELLGENTKSWWGEGYLHPLILLTAGAVVYFGLKRFQRYCEEEAEIPTFFNSPQ